MTHDAEGYWITYHGERIGPYDTKAAANDARIGLDRFDANCDKKGYVTSEKPATTQK